MEQLLPLISAIGFGIQQFLQVLVDPLASIIIVSLKNKSGNTLPDGAKLLPGGVSDVDAKKVILGSVSIILGMLIASSIPTIRILAAAGLTTAPGWDWFITSLTISAGTEGANSVLKIIQYLKDAIKTKTPPSVAQNSPVPQSPAETINADGDGGDAQLVTPNSGDDVDVEIEEKQFALPTGNISHLSVAAPALAAANVSSWRPAKSLLTLRNQVNAKAPNRNKASDGFIGDNAHAGRQSDHNPWVKDGNTGVVTAFDITHDPVHGCDANTIVEAIRTSRDERIKYIIWNRRIANSQPIGGKPAWAWRPYDGKNPHTKHAHISVKSDKAFYDSASNWAV